MMPERAGHIMTKVAIVTARHTDCEQDALVNLGPPLHIGAIAAPNPVIVIEVLSPAT
jgi:hypothetical protein